jgi:membrane fusion protein (multidrug efflux system)
MAWRPRASGNKSTVCLTTKTPAMPAFFFTYRKQQGLHISFIIALHYRGSSMRLILIAILLFLSACSGKQAGDDRKAGGPPASVTVVSVPSKPWSDIIDAVGTAKARDSVVIAAKQSERIAAVHFESGQRAAKGQVLVELDTGTVRADLAEAQASLNDLNAQVARLQNLQSRQLIAQSQLDTAVASRNAAKARTQAAQERLNDRIIRAPFAGVLGLRQVSPGQYVNAGAVMVNLDDLDHMWVDFPVPENMLAKLKVGMAITLEVDAFPGRIFTARVAGIDSRVDIATRAIMVRADIDNSDGLIRPGMLMRVALKQETIDALVVPELAIQQVGSRTFVYVADADGSARSQDVVVGGRRGGEVVILEGLSAGEKIIVEGTSKLRDGQKIKIVGSEAKPTAP